MNELTKSMARKLCAQNDQLRKEYREMIKEQEEELKRIRAHLDYLNSLQKILIDIRQKVDD